ncbi:hypothetical protein V8C86DRAFT_2679664 [Haematococcus lacustris]
MMVGLHSFMQLPVGVGSSLCIGASHMPCWFTWSFVSQAYTSMINLESTFDKPCWTQLPSLHGAQQQEIVEGQSQADYHASHSMRRLRHAADKPTTAGTLARGRFTPAAARCPACP